MAIEENLELESLELQRFKEAQLAHERLEAGRRKHEENIMKLRVNGRTKEAGKLQRIRTGERVVIAAIKLLPVTLLVCGILLLLLLKREVPQFIQDFIKL